MAKVFLICFSPFNPKQRCLPPEATGSATLFASLIQDLHVLQKLLEEESISLKWCSEAMFLIKTMHSEFLQLFSKRVSQASGSWERVDMVEEYLKESLDLLDLCNLLKSAISGIDRQRLMADFTINRSINNGFPATEVRVSRQKSCRVFEIQNWKEKSLSKTTKSSAVQSAEAVVSLMVYCALLRPLPIKIGKVCNSRLGPQNSFSGCIKRLVRCFLERFQAAGEAGLSEVEKMGNADENVSTLLNSSVALKEGLDLFKSVVDEVFNDVIQGRKKVLAFIASEGSGLVMDDV